MADSLLDQRPTLKELTEHVNVCTKWREVGIQLKLEARRLDAIDVEDRDINTKLSKMYELWLSSTPNATRRQLLQVLRLSSIAELTIASQYEAFGLQLSESKLYGTYWLVYMFIELQRKKQIEVHVVERNDCEQITIAHQSHEIVPTHLPKSIMYLSCIVHIY